MEEITEWLRPEFQGRDDDLVSLGDLAKSEGVSPSTVNAWKRRHAKFPQIVKIVRGTVTTKYISMSEFRAYKRIKEETPPPVRSGKTVTRRSRIEIVREDLKKAQTEDAKLEGREKALSAELADVLRQRQALGKDIRDLKQELREALAAIQEALGEE